MGRAVPDLDPVLESKKKEAAEVLRDAGRVVIALSGGVDSAVLLAVACEALGAANVLAVTGRSPAVTGGEVADACDVARVLGVPHETLETHELEREGYRANAGDRCFHCRTELFEGLASLASARGFEAIAYGAIVDDLGDHRPGMEAARALGVLAPLLEANIGKSDVRRLAIHYGLPISAKPASACLASRVPVGTPVSEPVLRRIAAAEAVLTALGFGRVRVRDHGETARIEVDLPDVPRFREPGTRDSVVAGLRSAGFRSVVVDLDGYRQGGAGNETPRLYSIEPQADGGQ
ncbi:MAG TPA: ATP-dependent sacrificial sulfur transferase LarE [Candidatus Polarisedimenticolaceae bacterium]|nr:ATP-dependent sacrificial sulfur transferase LarE [Candidatus Polarisedimenticolaceae bacterium]